MRRLVLDLGLLVFVAASLAAAWAAAAELLQVGPAGEELARAARRSFVDAMGDAVLVGAGAVLLAALVVLAFLPARPRPVASQPAGTDLAARQERQVTEQR